jgi:hypothetical protein
MDRFLHSAAFLILMAGSSPLAEGIWGGPSIQMTVGPQGAAVDLDCANGAIDGPIAVGSDGRFRASGTYAVEHGGPVREGEEKGRPAVYEGRVEGKKLTLVILIAEGKQEVGTFELTQGRSGRIMKCM